MVVSDFFFPFSKGGERSVYLGDGFGGLFIGWHGKGGGRVSQGPLKCANLLDSYASSFWKVI